MKHIPKVTIALVMFFFMAQFTGLLIINHYIDHKITAETKVISWQPLPYGFERPEVKNQSTSFIYITIAILVGTSLVLLLIKFGNISLFKMWLYTGILRIVGYIVLSLSQDYTTLIFFIIIDLFFGFLIWKLKLKVQNIWKFWFFATVWITLSIAFAAFINNAVAAIIALIISILKLYKLNVIIQNLSEIFIYGGLAAIFVPMMNIFAVFMLLIIISIYDFVAVFKTKHIIKLAEFQSKSKIFAGLLIPYRRGKISIRETAAPKSGITHGAKIHEHSVAVLGGGDIGFTLIFAGVVMKGLMLQETILIGFLKTLIIPVIVSLALLILLLKGQHNKFYPAMPILTLGCFLGYLIVFVV